MQCWCLSHPATGQASFSKEKHLLSSANAQRYLSSEIQATTLLKETNSRYRVTCNCQPLATLKQEFFVTWDT